MSNTIKIRNSGTSSNVPSALEYGELAINYSDGKLFYKDSSNNIVSLVSENAANIFASDTAPSSPAQKDLWFRTSTGQLFIRYDSHWVEIAMPDKSSATVNTNIGSGPFSPLDLSPVLWLDASDTSSITAADGAWLDGSGLVLPGLGANYASTPDSAALDITGDIDIKVDLQLADWTPSSEMFVVGRWSSGSSYSYSLNVKTDGTITLSWSTTGSSSAPGITGAQSTVATGFSNNERRWIRGTLDVDDGASGRIVRFYTSTDGVAWSQLGVDITGSNTSIWGSASDVLTVGSSANPLFFRPVTGTIYRTLVQDAFDTADNSTNVVFDADFAAEAAGTLSFTEDSTNAATVTLTTTYGQVSQWDDLSGNGNDFTQGTAANQPTTGTRTQNGLNVLDFNGTADFMVGGDVLDVLTGGLTMVGVVKMDATTGVRAFFGKSRANSAAGRYFLAWSTSNFFTGVTNSVTALFQDTAQRLPSSDPGSGNRTDVFIHGQRVIRNDENTLWRNGTIVATDSSLDGTTSYDTSDEWMIGAYPNSTGSTPPFGNSYLDGFVGEIIVFLKDLTDSEMGQVNTYLANKWGITI